MERLALCGCQDRRTYFTFQRITTKEREIWLECVGSSGKYLRMRNAEILHVEPITQAILVIRQRRILLDKDLATIYGVETRVLNQAVKRNQERFPNDFRFRLTADEANRSRSQNVILNRRPGQNIKFLPYAFTEHGAIMAATVLNSPRAIEMSIYIVRAFVQLRTTFSSSKELARQLNELEARIEKKLTTHDHAIAAMLSAIRGLMASPEPKRRRIGFTADSTD